MILSRRNFVVGAASILAAPAIVRSRGAQHSDGRFDRFAELPRVMVRTTFPSVDGESFPVASGGNLQTAINNAAAEDGALNHEVVLEAGATFTGNFTLPAKSGSNPTGTGWIIIRSDGDLPAAGIRVVPADSSETAKVISSNSTSVFTAPINAHHYWLKGLEITNTVSMSELLTIGNAENDDPAEDVHHFNITQCLIYGADDETEVKRGISLNTSWSLIKDNYIANIARAGFDSQAIWSSNGAGPFLIDNNYLEAASENIMFGGSAPRVEDRIPSDITITRNHFNKQTEWHGSKNVKNLLELKIGKRVLIEGNIMENCHEDSQGGHGFNLQSTNDEGNTPWGETSDVTVRFNILHNVTQPFSLSAKLETAMECIPMSRVSIHDNLFYDVGEVDSDYSFIANITGELSFVTIENNTFVPSAPIRKLFGLDLSNQPEASELVIRNNIGPLGQYGIHSGEGSGTAAFGYFAPDSWDYEGNLEIGDRNGVSWPANNTLVADIAAVGFTDAGNDDYSLAPGSPALTSGHNGTAYSGTDIAAVLAATEGVDA